MKGAFFLSELLLFWAILAPHAALAISPVARFVFITEPQTVPAGELSGGFTLQAQNAAGEIQQSDETIYLSFSSTSATGEFLNVTGDLLKEKTVMNTGTANRTFYYRDASAGTHTLTAVAVGKASGQSWTVSQGTSIRAEGDAPLLVSATPTVSSISAPSGSVSAALPAPAIEARAGPDRAAVAGAAIMFEGSAIGLMKDPIDNARFWWNFGDGVTGEGKNIGHTFRVPGAYTIGLHVSSGIYVASDYATVTVVPNKVEIAEVIEGEAGFIRIRNGSEHTVDIGGWTVEAHDGTRFVLPPRTMIRGKSDIALAHTVTGLGGAQPFTIRFSDGSVAFRYAGVPMAPESDPAPVPKVAADIALAFGTVPSTAISKAEASAPEEMKPKKIVVSPRAETKASSSPSHAASAGIGAFSSGYAFFGLAALLSAGVSVAFIFLKRFLV